MMIDGVVIIELRNVCIHSSIYKIDA